MLSELGSKSNQLPFISVSDQKGPYFLQYKVFEQRLKRQQKKGKSLSYVKKFKHPRSQLHEDYMELTRNIINKKQNLNLLQDLPCETEPSISYNGCEELAAKTRMLFEKKVAKKSNNNRLINYDTHSQFKQNTAVDERSRIKSQCNTNFIKMDKQKSTGISFIGYKRNKKPIKQMGIKRALGFF